MEPLFIMYGLNQFSHNCSQQATQSLSSSQFDPPSNSPWLRPTRYKPVTVDQMARDTHFTRDEVKSLYRAFKQECPTAILDEETFKEVYQKIFPLGESSKYAKLVFSTIDR